MTTTDRGAISGRDTSGLTRRDAVLSTVAGAGTLTVTGSVFAAEATPGLRDIAARRGFRFGTAVGMTSRVQRQGAFFDPQYRVCMERDCNLLVPENELKMYAIQNAPGDFSFEPADAILAYAGAHGMAVRGHTLLWARDEYTPAWLKSQDFGPSPAVAAEALLRDYILHVVQRYGEEITSWDVVNEAVNPTTGRLRSNVFTRQLGPRALAFAFQQARSLLPHTTLVYNDYMSWEAGNESHCQGVLDLLRWFRKHDVPVDALGVQSHLGTGFDLAGGQLSAWRAFIDEVTSMGFGLLITELDVNDQSPDRDVRKRDARNALILREYLDLMFSYRQLKDVLVWGLASKYSWLQTFTPRADKAPLRPTLYDADFRPTALRAALADAFEHAATRRT